MCFSELVRSVAAPHCWRGGGGEVEVEVEVQGGRPVGVGQQIRFNGISPNEYVNLVDHNYQQPLPRHDEEEVRGFGLSSVNEYVHLISNNNEMNTVSTGGGGGGGGSMGSKKNCDDEVMTDSLSLLNLIPTFMMMPREYEMKLSPLHHII